jgi:predicted nucleic acid-binding protein
MSAGLVFVDTNILVYAHDNQAGARHEHAQRNLRNLLREPLLPVISAQVLHELYVTLVRRGVAARQARGLVAVYFDWNVISNDTSLAADGMDSAERWNMSFWDALILAAARRAGAATVWSEDLNEGQDYDGVTVLNPLR